MRMLKGIVTALAVVGLGFGAYVRLAPSDVARWHVMPEQTEPGDTRTANSFTAARAMTAPGPEVLAALQEIALATPRTQVLAGDVASGMITFVTRSALMGYPDYTTVAVQGDVLVIAGRARFGASDLGVNAARVEGWLDALGPLTETL